jgi:hypothetical protein
MIKSRRMRWAWHVARMEEKRNVYRILVGSQKVRERWEDLEVDEGTILKWILER